jgi:hypothetical protein
MQTSSQTSLQTSPQSIYESLQFLDQGDVAKSALYRQQAQDVLANPGINLGVRQAIAERLREANHLLELRTADDNDSY